MPYLLVSVLAIPDVEPGRSFEEVEAEITSAMLLGTPVALIWMLWFWAVGIVANRGLPQDTQRPTGLLNLAIPFVMAYYAAATLALAEIGMLGLAEAWSTWLLIPHLLAGAAMLYAVIFAARRLNALDAPNLQSSGRAFLFFLGVLYFPIGIWWIQPRLNAVVEGSSDPTSAH